MRDCKETMQVVKCAGVRTSGYTDLHICAERRRAVMQAFIYVREAVGQLCRP